MKRRGRPRKIRPPRGSSITPGMSYRDMASALGMSRQEISDWVAIASLPDEVFEAALERGGKPSTRAIANLARRRAGKSTYREHCCPNCGYLLQVEP